MKHLSYFTRKITDQFQDLRFFAASLSFATLFAFIPFLVVIIAALQSIGVFEQFYPIIESFIFSVMKEATGGNVTRYIRNTLARVEFSTVGITGIVVLLATISDLFKQIDIAFHKIWKIQLPTSLIKRTSIYWVCILLMPLVLFVISWVYSLKAFSVTHQLFGNQFKIFFIGVFSLWVLYKFIPNTRVSTKASLISAILAGFLLAGLQSSFLWMALKIFKHNKIYGSLASFPIFLLWLQLVWIIVLLGVSFCVFLQQKIFKTTP